MERGIFRCPSRWLPFLPPQVRCPSLGELASPPWDLLALTREGARAACGTQIRCQRLLLPGDCPVCAKAQVVISYGLSPRDSLTLSGVRQPVLCIQRTLPGPDGALLEPQEIPLGELPGPPETLLGLLGLRLLLLPLTKALFLE